MDLLDVARGPVLKVALAVFVLGTLWRLFGILRLPGRPDRSPAREGAPGRARGALRAVATLTDDQRALMQQSDKGEVQVQVTVTDETGAEPVQCEFTWAWIPSSRPKN